MSFVTKRDRVFNDYEQLDLPPRNEGKLKNYSSCTDARAWSHFVSDKSEHLYEIIRRNNDTCRPKYVPTEVIVRTLMVGKNAEISRLKRKIELFEEMIAAYDQLDLTCAQKCEIANAHEAIRAANKDLSDMCLDLDLTGFTEGGIDTESFETGKSSGDMWSFTEIQATQKKTKASQMGDSSMFDASTSATDSRIEELRGAIVCKQAKLNAMQNTITVMENDACEPFCVYAHIYTALEKIFGVLCQNDRYMKYLGLLTDGQEFRCIDIKTRILYKLKVLEKFCTALIAPCTQGSQYQKDCTCCRAEVVNRIETTYALTIPEYNPVSKIDNKRAQLVRDIMESDVIKDASIKENQPTKEDAEIIDNCLIIKKYCLDKENLTRLKNLQMNYDELVVCYENLKHEKDCMKSKCRYYEDMEKEVETLRSQLNNFNVIFNERDQLRKRLEDIDNWREQYMILSEEAVNMELQLKTEIEINLMKTNKITELRDENIALEKRLNDLSIEFAKDKNILQCKLKETECKIMCQDQQIKSLSHQVDKFLQENNEKTTRDTSEIVVLTNQIDALKKQVLSLKDILLYSEEEKQSFKEQLDTKQDLINELRMEIENWKITYDSAIQRNNCLKKSANDFENDLSRVMEENKKLLIDNSDKTKAVENLINIIHGKSNEINRLIDEIERRKAENNKLRNELQENIFFYAENAPNVDEPIKNEINNSTHINKYCIESIHTQSDTKYESDELKKIANDNLIILTDNKQLQNDVDSLTIQNKLLLNDLKKIQDLNHLATNDIKSLKEDKLHHIDSLQFLRKQNKNLERKVSESQVLTEQIQYFEHLSKTVVIERNEQQLSFTEKCKELDRVTHSLIIKKQEIEELLIKLKESESKNEELNNTCKQILNDKLVLYKDLEAKNLELENITQLVESVKITNQGLIEKYDNINRDFVELKNIYETLENEKIILQVNLQNNIENINNLNNTLDIKNKENQDLRHKLDLEINLQDKRFPYFENKDMSTQTVMNTKQNKIIEDYKQIEEDFQKIKQTNNDLKIEKDRVQQQLIHQSYEIAQLKKVNDDLHNQTRDLISFNGNLEKSLLEARNELFRKGEVDQDVITTMAKEVQLMKRERENVVMKHHNLLEKLDDSDKLISNLSEQIIARNDKITILENHINSLEDEIRRLQVSLESAVNNGEQIKYHSLRKNEEQIKYLEAKHTKVTLALKNQIDDLNHQNTIIEEELFEMKVKADEFHKEKYKYSAQVTQLEIEKDLILSELRQLEIKSVGNTGLSKENYKVDDMLAAIERVKKSIEAKNNKNKSLEHTLAKVQTSSHLLLKKADEAQMIIEKEKLKINNEKDEAVKDRKIIAKQLVKVKEKLEMQSTNDKKLIKNLEAELLNQKLINEKINQKRKIETYKIETNEIEMQRLNKLYLKSLSEIKEVRENMEHLTQERKIHLQVLYNTKAELEQKSLEVCDLKSQLLGLPLKLVENVNTETQTELYNNNINSSTQTSLNICANKSKIHLNSEKTNIDIFREKDTSLGQSLKNILTAPTNQTNQIPLIDFFKECLLSKLQKLSEGSLEQLSISSFEGSYFNNHHVKQSEKSALLKYVELTNVPKEGLENPDQNIGIVFDKQSILKINSITVMGRHNKNNILQSSKSNPISELFCLNDDKNNNENTTYSKFLDNSLHKDVVIIYRDTALSNDRNYNNIRVIHDNDNKINNRDTVWSSKSYPEIIVERVTIGNNTNIENKNWQSRNYSNLNSRVQNSHMFRDNKILCQTKSANILHENVCRINLKPPLLGNNISKSTEMINKDKYSSNSRVFFSDEKVIRRILDNNKLLNPNTRYSQIELRSISQKSIPLMSRDIDNHKRNEKSRSEMIQSHKNFGLKYIIDTVNQELCTRTFTDLNYETLKDHSDQILLSDVNTDPFNLKSASTNCAKKVCSDKSFNVSLYNTCNYEIELENLTANLKHIEGDYVNKIEILKKQYENDIKHIIKEHSESIKSIQKLQKESCMIATHENEVQSLKHASTKANEKTNIVGKEYMPPRNIIMESTSSTDEVPVKIHKLEVKDNPSKSSTRKLIKTSVESFNVKPKQHQGRCSCALDKNIAKSIRNLCQQEDFEKRKVSEQAYTKYIASKIIKDTVDELNPQELTFLHLKVCRAWKQKCNNKENIMRRLEALKHLRNQRQEQERNAWRNDHDMTFAVAEFENKLEDQQQLLADAREEMCRNLPSRLAMSNSTMPGTAIDGNLFRRQSIYAERDSCKMPCDNASVSSGTATRFPPRGHYDMFKSYEEKSPYYEKRSLPQEHPTRHRRSHDKSRPSSSRTNKKGSK